MERTIEFVSRFATSVAEKDDKVISNITPPFACTKGSITLGESEMEDGQLPDHFGLEVHAHNENQWSQYVFY